MKYMLFCVIGIVFMMQIAFAVDEAMETVITVKVNGLVCDFCAQAIQKTFKKEEAIKKTDIDLTDKVLTIQLKPHMDIADEKIETMVKNAGYSVESIHRNGVVSSE